MPKLPHIQQIKKYAALAPRWIGENAFFGFLILFFIALLISSFVFYHYVFGARNAELQANIFQANFQETTLQNILDTWQERSRQFQEAGTQPIRNIFGNPQTTSAPSAESSQE